MDALLRIVFPPSLLWTVETSCRTEPCESEPDELKLLNPILTPGANASYEEKLLTAEHSGTTLYFRLSK